MTSAQQWTRPPPPHFVRSISGKNVWSSKQCSVVGRLSKNSLVHLNRFALVWALHGIRRTRRWTTCNPSAVFFWFHWPTSFAVKTCLGLFSVSVQFVRVQALHPEPPIFGWHSEELVLPSATYSWRLFQVLPDISKCHLLARLSAQKGCMATGDTRKSQVGTELFWDWDWEIGNGNTRSINWWCLIALGRARQQLNWDWDWETGGGNALGRAARTAPDSLSHRTMLPSGHSSQSPSGFWARGYGQSHNPLKFTTFGYSHSTRKTWCCWGSDGNNVLGPSHTPQPQQK